MKRRNGRLIPKCGRLHTIPRRAKRSTSLTRKSEPDYRNLIGRRRLSLRANHKAALERAALHQPLPFQKIYNNALPRSFPPPSSDRLPSLSPWFFTPQRPRPTRVLRQKNPSLNNPWRNQFPQHPRPAPQLQAFTSRKSPPLSAAKHMGSGVFRR